MKIGAVPGADHARAAAGLLREYRAGNVVFDPVLASTSGAALGTAEAVAVLAPVILLLTPNRPEAEKLLGLPAGSVRSAADMVSAAEALSRQYGVAVLLKGGHRSDGAFDDFFQPSGQPGEWFPTRTVRSRGGNHGTGCLLSSSIACGLAAGLTLPESIRRAKDRLTDALERGLVLGHGNGPVDFR